MSGAAVQLEGVSAIAVIDDAFESLSTLNLPAQESDAVVELLADLQDPRIVEDFSHYGVDQETLKREPYVAIDALTSPGRSLGDAYVALSEASQTLAGFILERHTMRVIVEHIRRISGCEVVELTPNDELKLQDKQLVFIDYYLEKDQAACESRRRNFLRSS